MLDVSVYEVTIFAKRLRLTPLLVSHAEVMCPILADEGLYTFTGDKPPESMAALEARYLQLQGRTLPDGSQAWLDWVVSIEEGNIAIGYVQATVTELYTNVAWMIGMKWQRCGYASEAALALVKWLRTNGVGEIRASIHPKHVASQQVARNAGLRQSSLVEEGEDVWLLGKGDRAPSGTQGP